MSQFEDFNTQNKLRIPLSSYAANIIESDCLNFSRKKATLINTIILNFYQKAECSISLRLAQYRAELNNCFNKNDAKNNENCINKILACKSKELKEKYANRKPADVNWQITLNNAVSDLLTTDPCSEEEKYYGNRPGHYVRALIEEYIRLPYYQREEIIFKKHIDIINTAIASEHALKLTNVNNQHFYIKPFTISTDPLSMYHYLIGYSNAATIRHFKNDNAVIDARVLGIRISRLEKVEIEYYQPGTITAREKSQIQKELSKKGVQFVSGDATAITVWLSDKGIKQYQNQIHLRPVGIASAYDGHIYQFECTEAQILYYFRSFGKDAKILSPEPLKNEFISFYKDAYFNYK